MEMTSALHQTPRFRLNLAPALRHHPLIWYFVLANGFSWLILVVGGALPCRASRHSWAPWVARSFSASCGARGIFPSTTSPRSGPRRAGDRVSRISASSS